MMRVRGRFFIRGTKLVITGFTLLAAWLCGRTGLADEDSLAWKANKGRMVISDKEVSASYESDRAMVSALRRAKRNVIKGTGGTWTIHVMAFLNRPAGDNKVNLVYYDVTKQRDQIYFVEIDVQPTQRTLQLNGNVVSKDHGFVAGHRYELMITRLVGGKEDVYARGTVTLK